MQKIVLVTILCCFALSCNRGGNAVQSGSEAATSSEDVTLSNVDPLDLSRLKPKILKGMSRESMIQLLGKPTWASIPGDAGDFRVRDENTGLILYWRNPGLGIIDVHFDKDYKVLYDEGNPRGPTSYTHMFEPPIEFECENEDRAELCQ